MGAASTQRLFQFEQFNSRWWAWNAHAHTILASQFSNIEEVPAKRIEIPTPDNDFLELDILNLNNSRPVVALFHGLEGSSKRFYIRNLMHELMTAGFSSVAVNFRGCGSRINNQRRFYHSGETEDYQTVFKWISGEFQDNLLYAVGFSLGGNALIKSLGEGGEHHSVQRAAVVSPPYDLKEGSLNLQKGFNRIYTHRFLKTLNKKLELKRNTFPDLPVFNGTTMYEFDDQITAPLHGFNNAEHYYETCSSKLFLRDVKRNLLIIHSAADTICQLHYCPFVDIEQNQFITPLFTDKGGHVGFLSSPPNWLNRTITKWFRLPNDSYLTDV